MSKGGFDPETVRLLAAVLTQAGLTELELQEGESRLRLVRQVIVAAAAPPPVAAPAVAPVPGPAPAPAAEAPPPAGAVTSPMVGIAYLAAEPGSPPYITLGQAVSAGQTVLLIEAMKTFNPIKAPHAGTVTQILVQSGAPVEYGQPLLVIA